MGFKKGHIVSEETKEKIRASRLRRKETLGYINSPETRAKMSIERQGRKISEWGRENMKRSAKRGEENNMWKGGITPLHLKIRNSDKNQTWKKSILERDNYTCSLCGVRGSVDLHVDHFPVTFSVILHDLITEYGKENAYEAAMNYPKFWDISNGRTLCIGCHKGVKHIVKRKKRLINLLEYNGETKSLVEWCKELGISHRTACGRQERGLPVDAILSIGTLIRKKDNIVWLEYKGERKPVTVWCNELGLDSKRVRQRIVRYGWTAEEALTKPIAAHKSGRKYTDNKHQIGKKHSPERIAKSRASTLATFKKRRFTTKGYNPISHQFNYKKAA